MILLPQADADRIEAAIDAALSALPRTSDLAFFQDAIRSFVLAGGKRIRPQLCVWTFRKTAPSAAIAPDALYSIACGWELFHAFLLVHDDIIDEAETRRNAPSLHRNLETTGPVTPKIGHDLAVVAGDLLFSAAMHAFNEADLPPNLYRRQLRLFSRIALTTGLGQALDIAQANRPLDDAREWNLLREYHWKTAAYTFEGPMLSGAILAGADESVQQSIARYALSLGQAYQLQNDLIDLAQPAHEGCDLLQGKRTVTLVRARLAMDEHRRRSFDSMLEELPAGNSAAVGIAEQLRREIIAVGAVDKTRTLIREFLDDARMAAEEPILPGDLRHGLVGLLDTLQRKYFA